MEIYPRETVKVLFEYMKGTAIVSECRFIDIQRKCVVTVKNLEFCRQMKSLCVTHKNVFWDCVWVHEDFTTINAELWLPISSSNEEKFNVRLKTPKGVVKTKLNEKVIRPFNQYLKL